MWQKVLLANLILTLTSGALAQATTTEFIDVGFNCNVRVISETPKSVEPIADVLFLHGFSDRADNHGPLFKQIAAAGFRVISFDYPSHGETRCWNLDLHDFTSLSDLAVRVLAHAKFQSKRPLFLTGWSTGGLLAYRLAQREYFNDRHLAGLVLLAPGFSVYKIPGVFGWVTQASLLSNPYPPHMGPIKPQSPLAFLGFSSALLINSKLARMQNVPQVPIAMFLGGDAEDVYAKTSVIKSWYKGLRASRVEQFQALQCAGAKHELDNEIDPIGETVRDMFTQFLVDPLAKIPDSKICKTF